MAAKLVFNEFRTIWKGATVEAQRKTTMNATYKNRSGSRDLNSEATADSAAKGTSVFDWRNWVSL
jgi:hypothetical protein